MFGAAVVWTLLLWNINANSVEEKQLPPYSNDNRELGIVRKKIEGLSRRTTIVNDSPGTGYVSSNGNDDTECGYDIKPCLTLQYAVDQVLKVITPNTRRIVIQDQYTVSGSVIISGNKQINFEGLNPNDQLPITIAGNNEIAFKGTDVDSIVQNFYIYLDKSGNISYAFSWERGSLSLRNNRVNFAEGSSEIGLAQLHESSLTITNLRIIGTPLEPLKFGSKSLILAYNAKNVLIISLTATYIDVESDNGLLYISQDTLKEDDPTVQSSINFNFVRLENVLSHKGSIVELQTELGGKVEILRTNFLQCVRQISSQQDIEGGSLQISYNGGDVFIGKNEDNQQVQFNGSSSDIVDQEIKKGEGRGAALYILYQFDQKGVHPGLIDIFNVQFFNNYALEGSNIFVNLLNQAPEGVLNQNTFKIDSVGLAEDWTRYLGIYDGKYFLLHTYADSIYVNRGIRYIDGVIGRIIDLCGDWKVPCLKLEDIQPESQIDAPYYDSTASVSSPRTVTFYIKTNIVQKKNVMTNGNIVFEGRLGLSDRIGASSPPYVWSSPDDSAIITVTTKDGGQFDPKSPLISSVNSSITLRTVKLQIDGEDLRLAFGTNALIQVEGPELVLDRVQILNVGQRAILLYPSSASGAVAESKGLISKSQIISPEDVTQIDDSISVDSKDGKDLCNFKGAGLIFRKARVQILGSTISGLEGGGIQVTENSNLQIDRDSTFEKNVQKKKKYPVMRQNVECTQGSTVIFEEGVMERETIVGTWVYGSNDCKVRKVKSGLKLSDVKDIEIDTVRVMTYSPRVVNVSSEVVPIYNKDNVELGKHLVIRLEGDELLPCGHTRLQLVGTYDKQVLHRYKLLYGGAQDERSYVAEFPLTDEYVTREPDDPQVDEDEEEKQIDPDSFNSNADGDDGTLETIHAVPGSALYKRVSTQTTLEARIRFGYVGWDGQWLNGSVYTLNEEIYEGSDASEHKTTKTGIPLWLILILAIGIPLIVIIIVLVIICISYQQCTDHNAEIQEEKKQRELEKKDEVGVETQDGYYLGYGYGYNHEQGVGYTHVYGNTSNIATSGRSIEQRAKVTSRGKDESDSTRNVSESRSKSRSTSRELKADKHKVPLTRSTRPFGTQGTEGPSQIFTTHRQNGSDIQDAEPDALPATMPTTIKLQQKQRATKGGLGELGDVAVTLREEPDNEDITKKSAKNDSDTETTSTSSSSSSSSTSSSKSSKSSTSSKSSKSSKSSSSSNSSAASTEPSKAKTQQSKRNAQQDVDADKTSKKSKSSKKDALTEKDGKTQKSDDEGSSSGSSGSGSSSSSGSSSGSSKSHSRHSSASTKRSSVNEIPAKSKEDSEDSGSGTGGDREIDE